MEFKSLYPRLVVDGADKALDFYVAAFGAKVLERHEHGGKVVHAMVGIGDMQFAVKDAGGGDQAPSGVVPVIMAVYVTDVDALAQQMLDAGATVIYPVDDHFYGERAGRLGDPFGHQWMIAQKP